jgi:HK97 family phage portal protein
VFYTLGGNWIVQNRYGPLEPVPQRNVLHIKLHCDQLRNPLVGQTPLQAAWLDAMTGSSLREQQLTFYQRQAKPGFVLSTDEMLDKDQTSALRDRWNEQTTGANVGGTPILGRGLKPIQIPTTNWRDAQLAEMMKLTDQEIAMAFRVPPQIVGLETRGGASYGSAEAMMQAWISSGLGFCLNHVEEAIGQQFELRGQPDEYVEFDSKALLRSAFKDRIDGLTRGVQGGIFSPNEARNAEEYDSVPFGNEPRLQQQVVPLSAAGAIPPAPAAPGAPGAPPAPKPAADAADAKPDADEAKATREAYAAMMFNRSRQIARDDLRRIA